MNDLVQILIIVRRIQKSMPFPKCITLKIIYKQLNIFTA